MRDATLLRGELALGVEHEGEGGHGGAEEVRQVLVRGEADGDRGAAREQGAEAVERCGGATRDPITRGLCAGVPDGSAPQPSPLCRSSPMG